ncbi:MAG: SGNH/GDSL hydrolase family protein [Candidatus Obscuribacterales bacterium]|jgi:hypothetical protein
MITALARVSVQLPSFGTNFFPYNDSHFQYLGRWIDTGTGYWCGWSGAQVVVKVSNAMFLRVVCDVIDPSTTNGSVLSWVIDNSAENSSFKWTSRESEVWSGRKYVDIPLPDLSEHTIIIHTNGIRAGQFAGTTQLIISGYELPVSAVLGSFATWTQGTNILQCVGDSWMAADADWPRLLSRTKWNLYPIAHGGIPIATIDADYNYDYGTTAASDPSAYAILLSENVNSYNGSVSAAAYETSLGSVVDKIRAMQASPPIFIIRIPDNTTDSKTWGTTYATAMQNVVAAKTNCIYIDTSSLDATLAGHFPDIYHLDAYGKQVVANFVDAAIITAGY